MTIVQFEQRGSTYAVTFAYDAITVDLLKLTVPAYARSWNPNRREWCVDSVYARPLAESMRRLGHAVVGLDESTHQSPCDDSSHWARMLFKRVGSRHRDRVYRALSRCLHPDVGGDTELQRELNAAHAELSTAERNQR